jgi:hypothetical protein
LFLKRNIREISGRIQDGSSNVLINVSNVDLGTSSELSVLLKNFNNEPVNIHSRSL